jgi:hypothetical protein
MSAVILKFPAKAMKPSRSKARIQLEARHKWMMRIRGEWSNEQTEGTVQESEIEDPVYQMVRTALLNKFGMPEPTPAMLRRDIAEGRKLIEKRNRVKAWLASLGADLNDITTSEQALFFAFDRLHASERPASA